MARNTKPGAIAEAPARGAGQRFGLRGIAQVVIGVGALALIVIKSDARGLIEAARATRVTLLPLAVIASFAVTWLMAYRWGKILGVGGRAFSTNRLFAFYLIGSFFTNLVPGGAVSGDVARLIYVDREVSDKAFVLSTLVYERLVGVFTLLLIGLAASLASKGDVRAGRFIYLGEAILALAFLAAASLMSDSVSSRLARLCVWAGKRVKSERAGAAASRTLESISALRRHRRMLVETVLISVLIRAVWSTGCFVVARAMGLPLGVLTVFAFMSLVDLIRLLPISIGGLGVREWALVVLFASVGLSREQALMFSFLAFAPVLLNAIVGGIIYISRAGRAQRGPQVAELDLKSSEV